ncbi:hypothetical protein AALP_AA6G089700 [Arabis alpina]|uniref:Cytochrome p450 n=1 Tax=Arabis alpina TaxID=50452 RepID=A0A087GN11_ARAAL|nr:hypothetical protein AALP_AA6G089700 [Arabis alpina]
MEIPQMEMILMISLFLTTLLALLLLKPILKRTATKVNLPPSPWRLPVIGNLHQLGLHPHRSLQSLSLRYGPLMLLHFGRVPVLVVSSGEAAQEVMKTHDIKFANRPKSKAVHRIMNGGRDVVFAPYGEYWRQMKSVCILNLLTNKMVGSFEKVRVEEVKAMLEKLEKASSSSSSVNLSEIFITLPSDVTSRVALGRKHSEDETARDLKNRVRQIMELIGEFPIGEYVPWLAWLDRVRGFSNKVEDDMFIGGTSTTSTLLEWTMTELIRHPECMKKLQDEVRSSTKPETSFIKEEEVENMKYLKAVIKEVLRLHPSLPMLIPRLLSEDVKLKGYNIAAGTEVIINAWAIQRDPAMWGPEAEEFKPERHLDSSLDYHGKDLNYIPFGSGRRICPGIGFALGLAEGALANLVARFDWTGEVKPPGDQSDLAEATGIDVCRKFPLIAFPSSVV